ncbi:helix-turn-helix domain-containing protein [Priestia aryabhattai]|uniref:AlbA family DNA-binding domain-containing protein n=1 Tax=Priestia aryabhattai TaxID=412384 RepID=UPI0035681F8B
MKKSWEWTESDILQMIKNETPESLTLDYKRSDSLGKNDKKKNEISKDVSAFANSAGGILIYGVAEDGNVPTSIDEGVDPNEITKEWLEQVIGSRIQRRISGIRINPIKLSPPSTNVIYVIDIPQSNLAPHMAADKKFYKRFNFESIPMEEYEVRDVGNRNARPDLEFVINIENKKATPTTFDCHFGLTNHSLIPAEYTTVEFYIDSRIRQAINGQLSDIGEAEINFKGQTFKTKKFYKYLSIPQSVPILYGIEFSIANGPVRFSYPRTIGKYFLLTRVTTAGVEPRDFLFHLNFDGQKMDVQKIN